MEDSDFCKARRVDKGTAVTPSPKVCGLYSEGHRPRLQGRIQWQARVAEVTPAKHALSRRAPQGGL